MNRAEALSILNRLRPALQARGVAHAGLFGSIARDEADAGSDVDVVITFAPGLKVGLLDLGDVQTVLEEGFPGLSVDMVHEPIRRDSLRAAIERDKAHAF